MSLTMKQVKDRALAELPDCANAVASMIQDLHLEPVVAMMGMMEVDRGPAAVRHWIDGFSDHMKVPEDPE